MIFAHFRNSWNFGDNNCCPADYFDYPGAIKCSTEEIPSGDEPVILGGGGLLFCGQDSWIAKLAKTRPVILWGVGLNYPACQVPENWADYLRECALVGLRDFGYVHQANIPNIVCAPCSSCMHSGFIKCRARLPEYPVVVYSHIRNSLDLDCYPHKTNHAESNGNLASVIAFLASGRNVVTNSFHGAYWGLLLGRRVIVYNPLDSNRFYSGLPSVPIVQDRATLNSMLQHPPAAEDEITLGFLERMRTLSQGFCSQVRRLL